MEEFIFYKYGNSHLEGYKYLISACEYILENETNNIKDVYKYLSEKYNSKICLIERAIGYYRDRTKDSEVKNMSVLKFISEQATIYKLRQKMQGE